ncbi:type I-E CRISPR-associated protein Cse2/CasB [Kitasatospora paranensis]|uniref:Type I-E CRISPR-associated protein Cse2/CasB n=1 Tax=Kitasatospora paranensis TaxID=258053 RepID=A0ABW2FMH4_9ACTN
MSDTTATTTIPAPRPATIVAAGTRRVGADWSSAELRRARAFTDWIDRRCSEDPGVRAALRRGVGKDLDSVPFMHRFVAHRLTDEQMADLDIQRAHYTVASLIAAQRRDQYAAARTATNLDETTAGPDESKPATPRSRSLGRSFADGVAKGGTEAGLRASSAETRLNLLTRQSLDGLHRHLPGAIRQLRGSDVDVDWAQLLVDLCRWRRHAGTVKRRWLQDYYRTRQADEERRAQDADTARAAAQPDAGTDNPPTAN